MAMKRLLLLLKPFDVYPVSQSDGLARITNPQVCLVCGKFGKKITVTYSVNLFLQLHFPLNGASSEEQRAMGLLLLIVFRTLIALLFLRDGLVPSLCEFCRGIQELQILHYLDNRRKVHKDAINFCQNILRHKPVEWKSIVRNNLSQPIRDVDLVVTVGGDGTLLQGSHFIDDSVPVLGVNSDPTQPEEVEKLSNEIDANRSTGYLCGATVNNFEQVLDNILEDRAIPSKLTRISVSVNSQPLSTYALNDILIAHPCPAALSRFSFKIKGDDQPCAPLAHSRSSGLRVSTAAGSTAAMLSAGGFPMPILSQDLQYMVREPISPGVASSLMHGLIKSHQSMEATWFCKKGVIYIDGSHVSYTIKNGDAIDISSKAPILKVFLPQHLQNISEET